MYSCVLFFSFRGDCGPSLGPVGDLMLAGWRGGVMCGGALVPPVPYENGVLRVNISRMFLSAGYIIRCLCEAQEGAVLCFVYDVCALCFVLFHVFCAAEVARFKKGNLYRALLVWR